MKTSIRNSLTSAVAFLLVVVAVSRAQAAKVTVVNTPSNPVPVRITGTPTVNIGNLPEGTNLVQITSSTNAPVIVRDADNAGQPFRQSRLVAVNDGEPLGSFTYTTVPAGKRLVIEFASVLASIPTGQQLTEVRLSPGGNNTGRNDPVVHDLLFSKTTSNVSGFDTFVASEEIRAYCEAGESPQIVVVRGAFSGAWSFRTSISGYYIDVP